MYANFFAKLRRGNRGGGSSSAAAPAGARIAADDATTRRLRPIQRQTHRSPSRNRGRRHARPTNERLENTSLVTNHMAKKLIAALLEEHRRRAM